MVLSLPTAWHKPADYALASALVGGGMGVTFIEQINPWLAFIGGILGLFIALVRTYHILFTKDKDNDR